MYGGRRTLLSWSNLGGTGKPSGCSVLGLEAPEPGLPLSVRLLLGILNQNPHLDKKFILYILGSPETGQTQHWLIEWLSDQECRCFSSGAFFLLQLGPLLIARWSLAAMERRASLFRSNGRDTTSSCVWLAVKDKVNFS